MKHIYAIRDRIANDLAGYFPLVVFNTDAQAIRYFADSTTGDKSAIGAHLSDYELVNCGTVTDEGTINGYETPTIILTGDALKIAMTQPNQSHA